MNLAIYVLLSLLSGALVYSQDPTVLWFKAGFWGLLYLVWGMLGKLPALCAPALVLAIRHVDIHSDEVLLSVICPLTIIITSCIILFYVALVVANGAVRVNHYYTLFNWRKKQSRRTPTSG